MTTTALTSQGSLALRWSRELGLLALLYLGYVLTRSAMTVQVGDAHRRGWQILHLEEVLFLDIERPLNAVAIGIPAVGITFAFLYATLHYVVTPAAMVWIALRRKDGYPRARTSLLAATALGLVCYWLLPTAPPRLLDAGFTDVMATFSGVGWWGEAASAPRGLEGFSNQFAAFPSLHVGWAMWVALALRDNVRSPNLRRWLWGYPLLMGIVVMATANHYLIDALAGVACVFARPPSRSTLACRRTWMTRASADDSIRSSTSVSRCLPVSATSLDVLPVVLLTAWTVDLGFVDAPRTGR